MILTEAKTCPHLLKMFQLEKNIQLYSFYILSCLAWSLFAMRQEELEELAGEEDVRATLLSLLPLQVRPR